VPSVAPGEQIVQERHKICLGPSISDGAADFARGDIKRGDQGFCAMPDILELPPFDVSRLHRQARRSMFQRLNTGHFVDRDGLHARLGNGGCRLIQPADIGALGVEVGIRLGRQPVAVAMRLEIRFSLRAARQSDRVPFRGVRAAAPSRSPAGPAGIVVSWPKRPA
jgi:hypothetical protein